jgi:hypothetical protein
MPPVSDLTIAFVVARASEDDRFASEEIVQPPLRPQSLCRRQGSSARPAAGERFAANGIISSPSCRMDLSALRHES